MSEDPEAERQERWFARIYERGLARREARISEREDGSVLISFRWRYEGGVMAVVTVLLGIILPATLAAVGVLTVVLRDPLSALSLFCVALAAALLAWALSRFGESITVGPDNITLKRGRAIFRRTIHIPLREVHSIAVETSGFANWDPYIAIKTNRATFRVTWSVSVDAAHEIIDVLHRVQRRAA